MEQTTFQKRIEEKARRRLLKDLLKASDKLNNEIGYLIEYDFKPILDVSEHYNSWDNQTRTRINNESSQAIFDKLLPKYISQVTDEILKKVDEIDWLVSERNQENNSDY